MEDVATHGLPCSTSAAEHTMPGLVIFARLPVPGKTKTRLAATIGFEQACDFYRACAEHIFRQCSRCSGVSCQLYHSDPANNNAVHAWLQSFGLDMEVNAQTQSPDLGVRMHDAMKVALTSGAGKVVIIGTDIPDISTDIIQRAFQALDDHQVVVGPAIDGGYYLLGLSTISMELFQGVEWSTHTVRQRTLDNAARMGLRVAPESTLPTLQDIDVFEDLQAWLAQQDGQQQKHPIFDTVSAIAQAAGKSG